MASIDIDGRVILIMMGLPDGLAPLFNSRQEMGRRGRLLDEAGLTQERDEVHRLLLMRLPGALGTNPEAVPGLRVHV
jgi:hypothetical protein